MHKSTVYEGTNSTKVIRSNCYNLEQRVIAMHQESIKVLQKEMVEISLQNNHQKKIGPILEEIKKVRLLLSFTSKNTQSC